MDFLDYREKLGVGFNDDRKFSYFKTKIFNKLYAFAKDPSYGSMNCGEYYSFCNITGTEIDTRILRNGDSFER